MFKVYHVSKHSIKTPIIAFNLKQTPYNAFWVFFRIVKVEIVLNRGF